MTPFQKIGFWPSRCHQLVLRGWESFVGFQLGHTREGAGEAVLT